MTIASDNEFPKIVLAEGTTPTTPASGLQKLFIDESDHELKRVDSSGTVKAIESVGFVNPMTADGDLIYGGASGSALSLSAGSAGQVLQMGATYPEWASLSFLENPMTAAGDLIYGGALGVPLALTAGSAGQVLKMGDTYPEWGNVSGSGSGMVNPMTAEGDLIYGGTSGSAMALTAGSAGQFLKMGATYPEWGAAPGGGSSADYILIQDRKDESLQGGTFTNGAWQTRELNTKVADSGGHASLAGNQITLAAGTYIIHARAPGVMVENHQAVLFNTTSNAITVGLTVGLNGLVVGSSAYCGSAGSDSVIDGVFSIGASTVFEIRHKCYTSRADYGLGTKSYTGSGVNIYTSVEFWKIA